MDGKQLISDSLSSSSDKYISTMINAASNTLSSDEINEVIDGKSVTNQMQMFLLIQAKKELFRIIKLTELLDKIESTYTKKVLESSDDLSIEDLSYVMSTITNSLDRSNKIISSVIKDDTLSVFVDASTNTVINNNSGSENNFAIAGDSKSRDKIRAAISQVLCNIQNYEDNKDSDGS